MKALTEFAFAPLAKSSCLFPFVFVSIAKRENNSPRADPIHRLLVAGFSPRKHIFRVDISCVQKLSSGLLIGSVAFLFHLASPRSSRKAKELRPE
jgi:hypothetical protein